MWLCTNSSAFSSLAKVRPHCSASDGLVVRQDVDVVAFGHPGWEERVEAQFDGHSADAPAQARTAGYGTTVTGHRPARTSRTASDPINRCPTCVDAPTTTASARVSVATRHSSA